MSWPFAWSMLHLLLAIELVLLWTSWQILYCILATTSHISPWGIQTKPSFLIFTAWLISKEDPNEYWISTPTDQPYWSIKALLNSSLRPKLMVLNHKTVKQFNGSVLPGTLLIALSWFPAKHPNQYQVFKLQPQFSLLGVTFPGMAGCCIVCWCLSLLPAAWSLSVC